MSTTTVTTADELALLSDATARYELIRGELITMTPPGWKHGTVAMRVGFIFSTFVEENQLGRAFAAETGFLLERDPDTVLAPDFSFISKASWPDKEPSQAYWPGPPDFCVEVVSKSDRPKSTREKAEQWIKFGCCLVWVIDPAEETIEVFTPNDDSRIFIGDESISGDPVLPGFECRVSDFFL